MALIAVAMNVLSAVSAFAAAVFWYLSARNKLPEMVSYWDGTPSDDPFFVAMQKGVTTKQVGSRVCWRLRYLRGRRDSGFYGGISLGR